jgi:hypothetical protein
LGQVQGASGLQLHALVDHVVEDVDGGVFGEAGAHAVEHEFVGYESFGGLGEEGVRALLVLLVGGDELVEEAG